MIIIPLNNMPRTRPNSFSISSTAKNVGFLNKNIERVIAIDAKMIEEIEITSSVLLIWNICSMKLSIKLKILILDDDEGEGDEEEKEDDDGVR